MGEAVLKKSVQTNFSDQITENPTNLLQRFSPEKPNQTSLSNFEHHQQQQQQLLDLNLRLSLGGLYGEKPIARSSSVAGLVTKKIINAGESDSALPGIFLSLTRSCSLPTETEKGQLKLKEYQAKKRVLVDKQRRGGATPEEQNSLAEVVPQATLAAWAAASAAKSPALCRAIVKIKTQGYASKKRRLEGLEGMAAGKDATSSQSLPNRKDTGPAVIPGVAAIGKSVKLENSSKRIEVSNGRIQHNGMDVMKQMPSVTTTGDGPNGKRIEGFLYKYMKGQVSIVCVCHGSFLSPAEFVRHAGGRDVENPMKHINVCHTF